MGDSTIRTFTTTSCIQSALSASLIIYQYLFTYNRIIFMCWGQVQLYQIYNLCALALEWTHGWLCCLVSCSQTTFFLLYWGIPRPNIKGEKWSGYMRLSVTVVLCFWIERWVIVVLLLPLKNKVARLFQSFIALAMDWVSGCFIQALYTHIQAYPLAIAVWF